MEQPSQPLPTAFVVHGHFYQPPRENPWTEEVAREPSAAPFSDWNERITAECYRPNGAARIFDEQGRVVAVVDNYRMLSFDVGPTLASWLETHAPDTHDVMMGAARDGSGGLAQAYFHVILPLATDDDMRTLVRWGITDYRHRVGKPPEGIWLPETAVDDRTLAVLAEEGIRFTILAPNQASRVRPLDDDAAEWSDVSGGRIDTRRTYRWLHPAGDGRGVDIVFYDGGLSHSIAFEMATLSSQALLDRVAAAVGGRGGIVTIATDGESFGHHHKFGDRLLAHALAVEGPRRGLTPSTVADHLRAAPPAHEVEVAVSAWSCAHGVGRWKEDCGCSTGGEPGWHQRWRAPLRAALDVLRDAATEVWERRAPKVLRDPAVARDEYVKVLIGAVGLEPFVRRHVVGDIVEARTLLEVERHALAMYTSCGWFFNDLAGLETVQVLRYAARLADLLVELGEDPRLDEALAVLEKAESNVAAEGNGRDVWEHHVLTQRVDDERVVAHLALVELLQGREPPAATAAHMVSVLDHGHDERGAFALCSGVIGLTHRRTGRHTEHAYAALHLGGLEVVGAIRRADAERDIPALAELWRAFAAGAPVTTLLRLVSEGFGPGEFDLRSALPGKSEEILQSAADALAGRFAAAYDRLFGDHRAVLVALARAGYPLPPVLRAPAELSLSRRLEAEVSAQAGSWDARAYDDALGVVREAQAAGVRVDTDEVRATLERTVLRAVEAAVIEGPKQGPAAEAALGLLQLARDLDIGLNVERAQELVYQRLLTAVTTPSAVVLLGAALGLAVEALGVPR